MNDLDLPPRMTLPSEVRDRIRTRVTPAPPSWAVRHRAPLSVAAAVAVVMAGAVIVGQSADDFRASGTTPSSSTAVPPRTNEAAPLPHAVALAPDAQTTEDLDHCGTVVAASPRSNEFAPRSSWEPVYTVIQDEVRITAFREHGGKPGFCEIDGTTARVSDPSAAPMPITTGDGMDTYALYLSPSGLLAGVAQGVVRLKFGVSGFDPTYGVFTHRRATPAFQDALFVAYLGELTADSKVDFEVITESDSGVLVRGDWVFDPAKVRPVGATGEF